MFIGLAFHCHDKVKLELKHLTKWIYVYIVFEYNVMIKLKIPAPQIISGEFRSDYFSM